MKYNITEPQSYYPVQTRQSQSSSSAPNCCSHIWHTLSGKERSTSSEFPDCESPSPSPTLDSRSESIFTSSPVSEESFAKDPRSDMSRLESSRGRKSLSQLCLVSCPGVSCKPLTSASVDSLQKNIGSHDALCAHSSAQLSLAPSLLTQAAGT